MTEETPEAEEFHPFVRLLLARMKSNPDEFIYDEGMLPTASEEYFTEAERAAVWAARREVVLSRSHEHLMQTILKSNEPDEYETANGAKYRASEHYLAGKANQVLASSTNGHTWTKVDHDAYLAQQQAAKQHLAAQINAQQRAHMQNQLGGLAQSQQAYSGTITMPTSVASALGVTTPPISTSGTVLVPDKGNTSASTWGAITKLLGR